MDNIFKTLREENICLKCHDIVNVNINYDTHVRECNGGDKNVITTKFYVKEELILQRAKKIKDTIEISTKWMKRPATR